MSVQNHTEKGNLPLFGLDDLGTWTGDLSSAFQNIADGFAYRQDYDPENKVYTAGGIPSYVAEADVSTAKQLKTARTIQTNLSTTTPANFDGSGDITPGCTGTLPVARGGTGATSAAAAFTNIAAGGGTVGSSLTVTVGHVQINSGLLWLYANQKIGLGIEVSTGNLHLFAIGMVKVLNVTGGAIPLIASNISGSSSIRYKKNVQDLESAAAEKLLQMRPVQFEFKEDEKGAKYGLIAEEVEKIDATSCYYDAEGRVDGVNYTMLVAPLIALCQRQQKEIDDLKARVEALENK